MKKSKIAFAFALSAALIACSGKSAPAAAPASSSAPASSPSASAITSEASPAQDTPSDVQSGMFIDFGDYTIEITDVKVIPADQNQYEKAPTIAFWYKTTNISKDNLSPSTAWIRAFEAYQDNNPDYLNELDVASLPDAAHRDTQLAKIKQGGSLENSVAYILDDLETPVLLSSGSLSPIKYAQEFPVK